METIDKIIAANIESRMAILKMDQVKLAKATGLTRQTINRILKGKQKSIRASNLELIAEALKTTRAALETRPIHRGATDSKADLLTQLYAIAPTLDEGKLGALLDFVRDLSAGSSAILDEARLELETKLNQKNK